MLVAKEGEKEVAAARRGKSGKRSVKRLNKRFEAFLSLSMQIYYDERKTFPI